MLYTFFTFLSTYMQFLAAKSLCITFMLARYSIPLAIWMHISISCLQTISIYSVHVIWCNLKCMLVDSRVHLMIMHQDQVPTLASYNCTGTNFWIIYLCDSFSKGLWNSEWPQPCPGTYPFCQKSYNNIIEAILWKFLLSCYHTLRLMLHFRWPA